MGFPPLLLHNKMCNSHRQHSSFLIRNIQQADSAAAEPANPAASAAALFSAVLILPKLISPHHVSAGTADISSYIIPHYKSGAENIL